MNEPKTTFTVDEINTAPTSCGIYRIRNTVNGKLYVGSAAGRVGIKGRWQEHRRDLDAGDSYCVALQRAWLKYGRGAFAFEILEIVPRQETAVATRAVVLAAEQRHLDATGAARRGYNALPTAGSRLGKTLTPEQRERLRQRVASDPAWLARLREFAKGRVQSEETKRKQSAAAVSRWQNPEYRERLVDAMRLSYEERGGPSAEHRAAISKGNKGKKISEAARQRMAASQTARWTDDLRKQQSEKQREAWSRPDVRERQAAAQRGRKHSPETLEKMRQAQRKRYADPVEAARMREAQQRGVALARERGRDVKE